MAKDKSLDWDVRRCNVEQIASFEMSINNLRIGEVSKIDRLGFDFFIYITASGDVKDFIWFMKKHPDLFDRVTKIYTTFRSIYEIANQNHLAFKSWVKDVHLRDDDINEIIKTEEIYLSRAAGYLSEIIPPLEKVAKYHKK